MTRSDDDDYIDDYYPQQFGIGSMGGLEPPPRHEARLYFAKSVKNLAGGIVRPIEHAPRQAMGFHKAGKHG